MLAILNSLNVHNLPIFESILMILVSKFMVHRVLSDKTYLLSGLLSPLSINISTWYFSAMPGYIQGCHCDLQNTSNNFNFDKFEKLLIMYGIL